MSTESVFQATDAKHAAFLGVGRLPNLIGYHVVLVDVKCVRAALLTVEAVTRTRTAGKFLRARLIFIIWTLIAHELTVTLESCYVKLIWKRVPHPATLNLFVRSLPGSCSSELLTVRWKFRSAAVFELIFEFEESRIFRQPFKSSGVKYT